MFTRKSNFSFCRYAAMRKSLQPTSDPVTKCYNQSQKRLKIVVALTLFFLYSQWSPKRHLLRIVLYLFITIKRIGSKPYLLFPQRKSTTTKILQHIINKNPCKILKTTHSVWESYENGWENIVNPNLPLCKSKKIH